MKSSHGLLTLSSSHYKNATKCEILEKGGSLHKQELLKHYEFKHGNIGIFSKAIFNLQFSFVTTNILFSGPIPPSV